MLVITSGEPAGIGPEIITKLGSAGFLKDCLVLGDRGLFPQANPGFELEHIPLAAPVNPGQLNPANSPYVLKQLDRAHELALQGTVKAVVTTTVHKGIINEAGIKFTGHTEYFANHCGVNNPIMLMVHGDFRLAIATTHIPLHAVPSAVTQTKLMAILTSLDKTLEKYFKINNPNIKVAGLNPHAGEDGYLGTEEMTVIIPVIQQLKLQGLNVHGPFSADTLFNKTNTDVFLAMYHDQGLPVIKARGFGEVVNVTLGLPYLRTSVDHGTALDRAGTGTASPTSLKAAVTLARTLTCN